MPSQHIIGEHRKVQLVAKEVLSDLAATICVTDTEASIADRAYQELKCRGLPDTWYYECPAFVLLGSRSCLSISGRDYRPANEPVGITNVVTVDLSPKNGDFWGDCARCFYIEGGRATDSPTLPEFVRAKRFLESMHKAMPRFVETGTTLHELFEWTHMKVSLAGFENLDFHHNVGHSIVTRRGDRQYIEAGNCIRLGDVPFFTFEPHVRVAGGQWGFKHEDIFYFGTEGHLETL
jgi:hypothetical protein